MGNRQSKLENQLYGPPDDFGLGLGQEVKGAGRI
jgi:hypothetical protein